MKVKESEVLKVDKVPVPTGPTSGWSQFDLRVAEPSYSDVTNQ